MINGKDRSRSTGELYPELSYIVTMIGSCWVLRGVVGDCGAMLLLLAALF